MSDSTLLPSACPPAAGPDLAAARACWAARRAVLDRPGGRRPVRSRRTTWARSCDVGRVRPISARSFRSAPTISAATCSAASCSARATRSASRCAATLLASGAACCWACAPRSRGGWTDAVLSRALDALISIPSKMFALVVVAAFGSSVPVLIADRRIIYTPGCLPHRPGARRRHQRAGFRHASRGPRRRRRLHRA